VIYRAELSDQVPGQLGNFPVKALGALISVMSVVIESPDDPMRTFLRVIHMRRAEFGLAGLVTDVINDARGTVTLIDVTWAG
jgi:hypothetical protein